MIFYRVGFITVTLILLNFSVTLSQYSRFPVQRLSPPGFSQNIPYETTYQPTIPRLGLQFGSGALIGAGGAVAAGLASMVLFAPNKNNPGSGFASMGAFILGGTLSYPFSSALGIYIVADNHRYNASYGNILLGSTLGTAAGLGSLAILGSESAGTGLAIALAAPIIGGMITNIQSIDKRSPQGTAFLNIAGENAHLSAPAVHLQKVGNRRFGALHSHYPTLKLLNISL